MKQLKKTLLTLVALLAVTTGAWAQEETPLTTITPTGDGTYSETTAGAVTVTPTGSFFYSGSSYGWRWDYNGSLTVKANEGYTIARCVFIQQGYNQSVTISEAPFALSFEEYLCLENYSMDGVSSIEVYGTAPASSGPEVAWDKAKKTGSFNMPGGNVELEPEYYPQAVLAAAPSAINDVPATTDGAIVNAGTVANIGETTTAQGTVMYYVSPTALDDAALLALDADQWTADVPTAESLAEGTAYVYYYVRGNDGDTDETTFSDGDIVKAANALTVTIAAAPTYAVTFADDTAEPDKWTASPNADVKKGQTVTVTYTGTKKVIGVKAEKKGGELSHALADAVVGEIVGTDGKAYAVADKDNLPDGVTAAGMVAYKSGSNGLVIALTDEASMMDWNTANGATGAAAHTPTVTSQAWKLPSQAEWKQMFAANGGNETSYSGLNTAITTAGGTALLEGDNNYWSSTEVGTANAQRLHLAYGTANFTDVKRTNANRVRACLAF